MMMMMMMMRKMFYQNIFSIRLSIPNILCFIFMLNVLVIVKQHKLVQYIAWIESIFSSYCITVRPAINLSLPMARNIVLIHDLLFLPISAIESRVS